MGAIAYEAWITNYKASKQQLYTNISTYYQGHHFGARYKIATAGKHGKGMDLIEVHMILNTYKQELLAQASWV